MALSAAAELLVKFRYEKRLRASLWEFWAAVAQRVRVELERSSSMMLADVRVVAHDALARILLAHYSDVARDFARDIVASMPSSLALTEAERAALSVDLARVFTARAGEQADVILATAQRRLIVAARSARESVAAEGSMLTASDIPAVTSRIWLARQRVGSHTVATFETQSAAEAAKGIATNRLLGENSRGVKVIGEALKVWSTQGDSRVRDGSNGGFDHLEADGQRVRVSDSFEVSGERLRWPGDWSLGATGPNIYGCRCSATYEVDSIAELRSMFLEAIRADTEVFLQTESAVVVAAPFAL